jgi:hypothetical protein
MRGSAGRSRRAARRVRNAAAQFAGEYIGRTACAAEPGPL